MPVHDWARVSAGTFHDFHMSWNAELKKALNAGLLPAGYYAQVEQHAGGYIADILTLQVGLPETPTPSKKGAPRSIAIRHASGHRVVALIEIESTANKDRARSVKQFVTKALGALQVGCHLLVIDVLPPGKFDPRGMHAALWKFYDRNAYRLPPDKPLTLAVYVSKSQPEASCRIWPWAKCYLKCHCF